MTHCQIRILSDKLKMRLGREDSLGPFDIYITNCVSTLAKNYKKMFQLDNARNILIDLAKEYLKRDKLTEGTDSVFGAGISEYIASKILKYYGV